MHPIWLWGQQAERFVFLLDSPQDDDDDDDNDLPGGAKSNRAALILHACSVVPDADERLPVWCGDDAEDRFVEDDDSVNGGDDGDRRRRRQH